MISRPDTTSSLPAARSIGGLVVLLLLAVGTVGLTFTTHYQLALLPGAAFLSLLLFARHPHWIYVLIVGMTPFWGLREIGGVNVQWPLGLLVLLILVARYLPQKHLPPGLRSDFWPLFSALLAIFALSALGSAYPDTAWENVRWLASAFLFVGLGFVLIDRELYLHTLPKVILWTISIGSFVSVADYLFDLSFIPPGDSGYALTSHPNNAAQMAIFAVPLAVHELVYRANLSSRLLALLLLLTNIASVIVSYSRAGFLILTATALIMLYEYGRHLQVRHTGLAIALIGIALATGVLTTPPSYWDRQLSLIEWQDSSLRRRTAYIEIGWQAFLQAPLLGTGPGTFKDIYPQAQKAAEFSSERESQMRRHAHNGYLELLVGSGALGLLTFLLILVKALRKLSRSKRIFLRLGNAQAASLTGCYRTSLISLIMYLLIGSNIYHKLLLLALALSHAAWLLSSRENTKDSHDVRGN